MWIVIDENKAFNADTLTKIYCARESYNEGTYRVFAEIVYTGEVALITYFNDECCAQEFVSIIIKYISNKTNREYPFIVENIVDGIIERHEEKKNSSK